MRFNKLDLNQLVVLDAVLSERSIKRAADKLFLSAPATSCALARLREYFEDDLLLQVGKTMVLTPKAQSLMKPVRDVLLQVQAITTTNPTFDAKTSTRKIIIQASDYVMNVFLGEVLRRVAEEAPLMQFDLRLIGMRTHEELEGVKLISSLCRSSTLSQAIPASVCLTTRGHASRGRATIRSMAN